jgi:hypothetical protein
VKKANRTGKVKCISRKERDALKQSVREARFTIRFWRNGLRRYNQSESNFAEIVHDEETLLRALRFNLGRESYRLNSPVVKEVVQHALKQTNQDFFIRLGQVLASDPLPWGHTGTPNRLEKFLLDRWAVSKDGLPELCLLTPPGLADVCTTKLKPDVDEAEEYTPEGLAKVRQRLGLLPFTRFKIKVNRDGSRLKFPEVDN